MRLARTMICGSWQGRLWGLALCVSVLLSHGVAQAATPQQKAQARELYTKGQQLFREGSYAEAERSFEEAYRVVPNAVVLLSIAECQTRSEQYQRAIDTLEAYLREKPDAKDKSDVLSQIEALRAKPATLSVGSDVPGADIWLDETSSGRITPAELSLPAGQHVIALVRDGYERAEQSVQLAPGERQSVSLTLVRETLPPAPAAPAPEPVAEDTRGPRHIGPGFWVATGIGVAGLATGITLGSLALKKEKDFNRNPTAKTADQGERMALFADVGFGIAGAAAVTALVLYLTSGKKKSELPTQAWSVGPTLSPGTAGAAARARF